MHTLQNDVLVLCGPPGSGCTNGCGTDPDVPVSVLPVTQDVLQVKQSADDCSGTTNCQTGDDQACTDIPRIPIEGQCAGQRSPAATAADLVLVDLAINEYGFDQVRYRLNDSNVIPFELIETAIVEFKKFLQVIAHATGPVGMISPVVDEVWHAFILHTPDYMRFTQNVFGAFLHHMPNTPDSPSDSSSVPNFVNGYKELFGDLDPIWTMHQSVEVAECSPCGNQCSSRCSSCHTCKGS